MLVDFLDPYPSPSRVCTFHLGDHNSKLLPTLSFQKRYLLVPLSYSTSLNTRQESKSPAPHSDLLFLTQFSLFGKSFFLPIFFHSHLSTLIKYTQGSTYFFMVLFHPSVLPVSLHYFYIKYYLCYNSMTVDTVVTLSKSFSPSETLRRKTEAKSLFSQQSFATVDVP